jgi:hypothetical protein
VLGISLVEIGGIGELTACRTATVEHYQKMGVPGIRFITLYGPGHDRIKVLEEP